jgi:hypothetical protein
MGAIRDDGGLENQRSKDTLEKLEDKVKQTRVVHLAHDINATFAMSRMQRLVL